MTALSLTANRNFDGKKERAACIKDLLVEPFFQQDSNDKLHWQVTLKVTYRPGPDINAPYHFASEIVGLFQVSTEQAKEKVQWLVETNASSLLYSTARELLRNAMSSGPYPPMLLPTGSFYEPKKDQPEAVPVQPQK